MQRHLAQCQVRTSKAKQTRAEKEMKDLFTKEGTENDGCFLPVEDDMDTMGSMGSGIMEDTEVVSNKEPNKDDEENNNSSSHMGSNEPPVASIKFGHKKRWFEWVEPDSDDDEPEEEDGHDMSKDRQAEETLLASYREDDLEVELLEEALAATNIGIAAAAAATGGQNQDSVHEDEYQYEERYREVTDRNKFRPNLDWTWPQPDPSQLPAGKLRSILEGPEGRTMGCCFSVDHSQEKPIQLEDSYLSMLRLMEYCDMNPMHSRKFLDGLLDIVAEEITSRNFNLLNRPRRETVCGKVVEMYGVGCEPEIAVLTTANEEGHVVIIEKAAPPPKNNKQQKKSNGMGGNENESEMVDVDPEEQAQNDIYRSVPQEIDNRKHFAINVIRFNIRNQLLDLLSDRTIFGSLDNLVVNAVNPFLPYTNSSGKSEEFLDGSWYKDSLRRLKEFEDDPFIDGMDFLMPFVFYVDKTGTTMNQRYPLEPFLFTVAVIKRGLRNRPRSWRPLGFIPDLETKSSAEQRYVSNNNRGATAQSYHRILEYMLEGFQEIQNNGIVHWLMLGNHRKKVRIRPEMICIIQDGKSADMITLRVPSNHESRRISRSCKTLQYYCDRVCHKCEFLELDSEVKNLFRLAGMSAAEIREDPLCQVNHGKPTEQEAATKLKEVKDKLNKLSFHPVRSAFLGIRFGFDPRSIWGATPVDLMHAFQSGVLMYVVKMALDKLQPAKQVKLDRLVDKLFHGLRCGEKKHYPRMNFSKGFSKLTMLTSDEWAGKLFVLLLVLNTVEGGQIFASSSIFDEKDDVSIPENFEDMSEVEQAKHMDGAATCLLGEEGDIEPLQPPSQEVESNLELQQKKTEKESPEEMARPCSRADFIQLAEALLCFHAWYKSGCPDIGPNGEIDRDRLDVSIQHMLAMVRYYTPRMKGNGWKLPKFHDLKHTAEDVRRFGPAPNFDAGPHESGLRFWAKLMALTAQTRGYSEFARQVSNRTHETLCISKALRCNGIVGVRERRENVAPTETKEKDGTPIVGGTRYRIYHSAPQKDKSEGVTSAELFEKLRPDRYGVNKPPKGVSVFRQSQVFQKKKAKSAFFVSPVLENFLRFQARGNDVLLPTEEKEEVFWELHTEVSFPLPNHPNEQVTLRCHPNYKNEGPWYDWVMVEYDSTDYFFQHKSKYKSTLAAYEKSNKEEPWCPIKHTTQYEDQFVPSKVLAVASVPPEDDDDDGIRILVHPCLFRTTGSQTEDDTTLLEFWHLAYTSLHKDLPGTGRAYHGGNLALEEQRYDAPQLNWIRTDSILCTCLVIEETPGLHQSVPTDWKGRPGSRVILVRGRDRWGGEFTDV